MSEPITSDATAHRRIEPDFQSQASVATELAPKIMQAPKQPKPVVAPPPAPDIPLTAPFEAISEVLVSAQEIARGTAMSLADSRLQSARAFIGLQQMLLQMVHTNLRASFAVAQKIVAAPNFRDAVTLHSQFAQEQVRVLTEQAAKLRQISTKLATDAPAPWVERLAKIKKGLEK